MGNKIYCHPLTIADSKSRFLFSAKGHYHKILKSAKAELQRSLGNIESLDKCSQIKGLPSFLFMPFSYSYSYLIGLLNLVLCLFFLTQHIPSKMGGMNECPVI
jgi:hypothetical protein